MIRSTDGITETLSFGYVSDQLTEDWYNDGDSGFLRKYRGENLSARLEWEDGADIRRTEYFLEENPERTTEYDLISGRIRMRWFSAEGDVIREKYSGEGIPDEEIVSVYAEGNLVNRKRITQEQFEEWQYTYSDEGALTEEWFVRNGSPVKTTYYDSETEYREELYRAGEVFLVVYFVDDRRIAEKFLMQEDDETTAED